MKTLLKLMVAALLLSPSVALGTADRAEVAKEVERKARYVSVVDTKVSGIELTKDEEHLVSEMAGQVMTHVKDARYAVSIGDKGSAKSEISQAKKLVGLINKMLPVTTRTTSLKDSSGRLVYSNTEEHREDLIPMFETAVGVKVVAPLVDVKQDDAQALGSVLTDADIYNMSLWVDLPYVYEKLVRAERFIAKDEDEKARVELRLAQSRGVKLKSTHEENPLLRAMEATTLAEENLKNGLREGAQANLLVAKAELETYKSLFKNGSDTRKELDEEIAKLSKQIEELSEKAEGPGIIDRIGSMTVRLFSRFRSDSEVDAASEVDKKES